MRRPLVERPHRALYWLTRAVPLQTPADLQTCSRSRAPWRHLAVCSRSRCYTRCASRIARKPSRDLLTLSSRARWARSPSFPRAAECRRSEAPRRPTRNRSVRALPSRRRARATRRRRDARAFWPRSSSGCRRARRLRLAGYAARALALRLSRRLARRGHDERRRARRAARGGRARLELGRARRGPERDARAELEGATHVLAARRPSRARRRPRGRRAAAAPASRTARLAVMVDSTSSARRTATTRAACDPILERYESTPVPRGRPRRRRGAAAGAGALRWIGPLVDRRVRRVHGAGRREVAAAPASAKARADAAEREGRLRAAPARLPVHVLRPAGIYGPGRSAPTARAPRRARPRRSGGGAGETALPSWRTRRRPSRGARHAARARPTTTHARRRAMAAPCSRRPSPTRRRRAAARARRARTPRQRRRRARGEGRRSRTPRAAARARGRRARAATPA